jgi:HD-like signal output (HDOD) protein
MTTLRSSFAAIIEGIRTIPALPEVAARVARLAGDPATTIPMIAQVIVKDAGMAAKMLRLANSAVYALREPVHDIDQALGLLGCRTIRSIALSVSVVSLFQQEQAHFNMRAYWLHSAVAAGMCRSVARLSCGCDPEHAFTFGLLKDIGKVILVENAPAETRAIIRVAQQRALGFTSAARAVLDTDDAEIAAWLCQTWELDPDLVDAIRFQHDLEHAAAPVMTAMGMVVDHLCALRGIRTSGSCDTPLLDPRVWRHLGLDQAALEAVKAGMNSDIAAARELLAIAA